MSADIDLFAVPVHPAANVFPMLPDDELHELAEHIKAHGQQQPIVICNTESGTVLLDGRNRRAACKLAGVEPRHETYSGPDLVGYIVGANAKRRNLSKSQLAMAIAKCYPEPEKGGRGKRNSLVAKWFSGALLSQARRVLRDRPDLAEKVLAGTWPLQAAYHTVNARARRSHAHEQHVEPVDVAKATEQPSSAVNGEEPSAETVANATAPSPVDAVAALAAADEQRADSRAWSVMQRLREGVAAAMTAASNTDPAYADVLDVVRLLLGTVTSAISGETAGQASICHAVALADEVERMERWLRDYCDGRDDELREHAAKVPAP